MGLFDLFDNDLGKISLLDRETQMGKAPSVKHDSLDLLTPQQWFSLNELIKQLSQTSTMPTAGFDGDLTASMSPVQAMLNKRISGGLGEDLITGTPTNIDDIFLHSVENPLLKTFNERILPSVDRRYAGGGFYGSDRNAAVQSSTRDLLDTLASERSKFTFNSRESAKNRQTSAIDLFNQIGGDATGLEERNLARLFENHALKKRTESDAIAQLLQALGIQTKENVSTVDPGKPGLVAGMLQGGGGGALGGLLGSVISDRRLKHFIYRIGYLGKGINLYLFRYRWSFIFHVGFMSDEIKLVLPDAVRIAKDGYDRVNYLMVIFYLMDKIEGGLYGSSYPFTTRSY